MSASGRPEGGALRILQVSAFFPAHGGGIERVAAELAARLPASGVELCWMAGGARNEWPDDLPGVRIDRVASWDPIERRLGIPLPFWGVAALTLLWRRVGESDVVHVHDYLYLPTLAALVFAAWRGKPVVLTQHVGEIRYGSRLASRALGFLNRTLGPLIMRRCDQVVFVSRIVAAYFEGRARFRRAPLVVANGVDHAVYAPRFEPATRERVLRCLFVGRFVEKKGLRLLERCVDLPGTSWTFVGQGPLSPQTWVAKPAGLRVVSGARHGQVVPYYQDADLLVLPSQGEGFPLVVQEALSCATPVLVSREVHEAFPHTDPACVFDVELRGADAAGALRARLDALAEAVDEVRAARPAAAGLARQWSWDACVQAYLQAYRQACRSPRREE